MKSLLFPMTIVGVLSLALSNVCRAEVSTAANSSFCEEQLAVLSGGAPSHEKAMACRAIALMGDESAAVALGPLLANPEVATYAQTALQQLPGESPNTVLRESLDSLGGDLLAGAITSLGVRRDKSSVSKLAGFFDNSDGTVATAALRAVGRIGGQEALDRLESRLRNSQDPLQPIAGWAYLDCAHAAELDGESEKVGAIYRTTIDADLPPHITLAAKCLLVANDCNGATDEFAKLLASANVEDFRAALQLIGLNRKELTTALVDRLSGLSDDRKSLAVLAIANLGDPDLEETFIKASTSSSESVRAYALEGLARLQSNDAVQHLLKALDDPNELVILTAIELLATANGDSVDSQILKYLQDVNSPNLSAAALIAGRRGISAATPRLTELAQSSIASINGAALAALGSTINESQLPQLILLALDSPEQCRASAARSLSIACTRFPGTETVNALTGAMASASTEQQVFLLERLAEASGEEALKVVSSAADSPDAALQDAASRLLGQWSTADAAPILLEIATPGSDSKYRVRALRGYLRIARQLDLPVEQRMEMCEEAIRNAERAEEKLLALEVLSIYPHPEGLRIAAGLVAQKHLNLAAVKALVAISEQTANIEPMATASALRAALRSSLQDVAQEQIHSLLKLCDSLAYAHDIEAGFVPLFDGETFNGWRANSDIFRIEDRQIVGGDLQRQIPRNEFLCTDSEYGDFELRLQFKLLGESPNAGVQFRSAQVPESNEVSGYQADLAPDYWGKLYDESRRNTILAGPADEASNSLVVAADWNDYRIRCEESRIRIWINGEPTVDYLEPESDISLRGIIGLQVHSGEPTEARYRNIRIKPL